MNIQSQSLREKAANGGRWTAISAIVSVVLQMTQIAVLARLLGPAEFGLMAMMMLVIGLINVIADFGLGNYLVQKEQLSISSFKRLLIVVTGLASALAILVANSSFLVAEYFNQPVLVEIMPWLSISIIVFTISQMLMSLLQRFFVFKQIAVGEIISGSLTLLVTAGLAFWGYGVWALVIGQIVSGASRVFIFAIPTFVLMKQLDKHDEAIFLQVKGFVFYQTSERLLNYVGWNLDKVIIGRMLGDAGLGLYSVCYQLMMRPFSVLNPIFTRVALPLFVNIRNDDARLAAGYLQTLKTIALLSFPIYMVMAISSSAIIHILMGDKWTDAAPVLYVLSLLGLFFSIGNPLGTLILAKAKPQYAFYLNLICLFVYSFAFWIGSNYSVLGVAIAFLFSVVILMYPIEFYLRYKLVGMSILQYMKSMGHLFIAAGIPLTFHAFFYLPKMMINDLSAQVFFASSGVVFFYCYLIIFDRKLIASTINLIFKGK